MEAGGVVDGYAYAEAVTYEAVRTPAYDRWRAYKAEAEEQAAEYLDYYDDDEEYELEGVTDWARDPDGARVRALAGLTSEHRAAVMKWRLTLRLQEEKTGIPAAPPPPARPSSAPRVRPQSASRQ